MKEYLRSWNSIPRAVIFCCILLISIDNSSAINEDENHQQNMEITRLKEIAGLQDKPNHQKIQKDQPNDQTINQLSTRTGNDRPKRPYRLLPPYNDELDGDGKRKGTTIPPDRQFYGPPTGCSDLSLLGFTLNGFYQVKSNESTNSVGISNETKLDTVFCAFKQPGGTSDPSFVEKRIISRRETKSSNKIIFHATRKTDFKANIGQSTITFENVFPNSQDAFNSTSGVFTVPQSGVYLFIFRGKVSPSKDPNRELHILILGNYVKQGPGKGAKAKIIAVHTVLRRDTSSDDVELDKVFKANRGDNIQVDVRFYEFGARFSGNSISLTGHLLNE